MKESQVDALSTFDFSKVTGGGLFLKFTPGEPVIVRVLTVDPIVANESYTDKKTGEPIVTTKFSFIVYNWTENKAQILKATPNTAKRIGELHTDEDFGADIRKVDLKITPPEAGEIKAYLIEVLPKAKELTQQIIKECAAIDLADKVEGDRMSFYKPPVTSGYEQAKATARAIDGKAEPQDEPDAVVEDIGDEPINLDDIPF